MKNEELRRKAAARGVKLWQIAGALGITDASFSRKLRYELSKEMKDRVLAIIDELSTWEDTPCK